MFGAVVTRVFLTCCVGTAERGDCGCLFCGVLESLSCVRQCLSCVPVGALRSGDNPKF